MAKLCDSEDESSRRHPDRKKVRVGRTRLGKGIFAGKNYQASAIIGEILGDVIGDPKYGSDYCLDIGDGYVLEPHAPFRYVNHSCEPNCRFDWFDVNSAENSTQHRRVFLIARREIRPGEELTIHYNWSASAAIPCRCQTPSCSGWIVDEYQLDQLPTKHAAS